MFANLRSRIPAGPLSLQPCELSTFALFYVSDAVKLLALPVIIGRLISDKMQLRERMCCSCAVQTILEDEFVAAYASPRICSSGKSVRNASAPHAA
jgi:hypothetical protein